MSCAASAPALGGTGFVRLFCACVVVLEFRAVSRRQHSLFHVAEHSARAHAHSRSIFDVPRTLPHRPPCPACRRCVPRWRLPTSARSQTSAAMHAPSPLPSLTTDPVRANRGVGCGGNGVPRFYDCDNQNLTEFPEPGAFPTPNATVDGNHAYVTTLHVGQNSLTELPSSLSHAPGLVMLAHLYLGFNKITAINPGALHNFTRLKSLVVYVAFELPSPPPAAFSLWHKGDSMPISRPDVCLITATAKASGSGGDPSRARCKLVASSLQVSIACTCPTPTHTLSHGAPFCRVTGAVNIRSDNMLSGILDVSTLAPLRILRTLELENNDITGITGSFKDNHFLYMLVLADNKITQLSPGVFDHTFLNFVDLDNNNITALPITLLHNLSLTQVSYVSFEGNPMYVRFRICLFGVFCGNDAVACLLCSLFSWHTRPCRVRRLPFHVWVYAGVVIWQGGEGSKSRIPSYWCAAVVSGARGMSFPVCAKRKGATPEVACYVLTWCPVSGVSGMRGVCCCRSCKVAEGTIGMNCTCTDDQAISKVGLMYACGKFKPLPTTTTASAGPTKPGGGPTSAPSPVPVEHAAKTGAMVYVLAVGLCVGFFLVGGCGFVLRGRFFKDKSDSAVYAQVPMGDIDDI